MFSHIQSFVIVLKVFGFSVFFILIGSILNNFAPLQVKPKHFNLGFSGTLRLFFVILLRAYYLFLQLSWTVRIQLQLSHRKLQPPHTLKKNLLNLKARLPIMTSYQRTIEVCQNFVKLHCCNYLAIHKLDFIKKQLILYIHFYPKYLFQLKSVQTKRIRFMYVPLIVKNDGLLSSKTVRMKLFSVRKIKFKPICLSSLL